MINQPKITSEPGIFNRNKTVRWFDASPGEQIGIRVGGEAVNGEYSVFDLTMKPGYGPPLHIHNRADEIFRIISGKARFHVEGMEFNAEEGDIIVVPKGTLHCFANFSDTLLHMSIMFTPAGDERVFSELSKIPLENIEEFVKEKYNTVIVGPPLQQ